MREGKMAPKIRFPGFDEPWEQRKLCDTFDFLQNNTLSRADLDAEIGVAKNVHYGDVLIKFGEYLDASCSALPYITSQQIVDKFKSSLLQDGDVIMADTAEDETVGKCTEIAEIQGFPTIAGLHTIPLRPKKNFSPGYLGYYMNSVSYHNQLLPLMQGIKVTSVSKSAISNTNISYPASRDEQTEIGNFFIRLDAFITLYQRECDKWRELKKGMLQKMFPKEGQNTPEIRFPRFSDAWNQIKLDDIYDSIGNAFVGTATPYYVPEGHFYLESNNVKDGRINHDTEVFISDEFYEKQKDKWLHTGDMIMVQSGHVGHAAVIPESLNNSAAHALIMFRNPKMEINPYFLLYQYQTKKSKDKIGNITTGNTIKHILASDMQEFVVDIPNYEEQEVIAHFFIGIDNIIDYQQSELNKWKELKKGLLQQMFIA